MCAVYVYIICTCGCTYVHVQKHTYKQIYVVCLQVHVIMCTCVRMHECYSTACVHSPCNCWETSKGCASEVLVTGSLPKEDFFGSVVSESGKKTFLTSPATLCPWCSSILANKNLQEVG